MTRKLSASIDLEVPFHDLDPVEIVWHGHYPKYLAVARDALMQAIGYSHVEMRATGYAWVMVEMKLRYLAPARLSDRLRVTATLLEYDPLLKIAYHIVDAASGRRLTRALTVQAPVTLADGVLVQAIPEVFRKPIECALREVAR
jgi:acyl-CoA thioester hydrolase